MKLETFFKKFDLFADAPNAVAKMRELVLQLAVQGKLVPQDDSNESAELLIKCAAMQAQKLPVATKYQRLAKEAEERLADCELQSLPRGWVWTCSAVIGDTAPRVDVDDDALVAFAPMNLLPTDYRSTFEPEVRPWREIKKGYTHFADGDVGFAKITPCFQNGKGCVFKNLPGGAGSGTTELHILRPFNDVVLPLYALLFYKSPEFVVGGVASFSGTAGQQRVSNDYFRFAPFPLPPLAEQKRIVAKVDELMALCDRLEAQQQERETRHAALARASLARFADAPTPANLQFLFHPSYDIPPADLRKAILTLAVDGSLINTESNETKFGEVVDLLGGYAFKSEWFTKASGIRLVRNQNISHGELDWRETEYLPNARAHEFERWALRPGDLVLSLNRPFISTGLKLAWIRDADCPCLLVQRIVCLRPNAERLLAKYLYLWCNAPHFYRNAHVVPSSGVPYIAPNRVAEMMMRLPPLAEQRRIVAKVEQLMALVDALETQLAASRATAKKLLAAAVAELTNGKEYLATSEV